jgi:hypothetical protein
MDAGLEGEFPVQRVGIEWFAPPAVLDPLRHALWHTRTGPDEHQLLGWLVDHPQAQVGIDLCLVLNR